MVNWFISRPEKKKSFSVSSKKRKEKGIKLFWVMKY